ncbi:sigma factor G inhibitor Gin [Sporolactobacillus sp. CPB3-1]|uniref:Sigma factor G inhibitor Gin n=1 Tax=Sporolactobacillus mangiferae TaxID=2940498 RepID=A0ABT0MCP4_9BACL|nr:sigma factor G inhibitor Gin [Sporolactobacillus mangiferae]
MAVHEQGRGEERCLICGKTQVEGIHICDQLICDSCQKKIVETDVMDWKYRFYMNKLAKLKISQSVSMKAIGIGSGSGREAGKS